MCPASAINIVLPRNRLGELADEHETDPNGHDEWRANKKRTERQNESNVTICHPHRFSPIVKDHFCLAPLPSAKCLTRCTASLHLRRLGIHQGNLPFRTLTHCRKFISPRAKMFEHLTKRFKIWAGCVYSLLK